VIQTANPPIIPTLWLLIASEGWMTQREIIDRVGFDPDFVRTALWQMANRWSYLQTRGSRTTREFSVSEDNNIPPSIPLRKVLRAINEGKFDDPLV
jgi:hypothetical protein